MTKTVLLAGVTLAVIAGATAADAQDREGRWEFTLGTFYQLGTSVDGQEGTGLETDNDFRFEIGGGFNFSDNLATTFNLQWAEVGYDATALDEDLNPVDITGKYDSFTVSGNLGYTSQWMDFDAASGTPRFDVFTLDFGWMF